MGIATIVALRIEAMPGHTHRIKAEMDYQMGVDTAAFDVRFVQTPPGSVIKTWVTSPPSGIQGTAIGTMGTEIELPGASGQITAAAYHNNSMVKMAFGGVTLPNPVAPTAAFDFTVDGDTVNCTNASTGSPTSYVWDFGDGETSTDTNPTHMYSASGTYTIKLIATNTAGSTEISKSVSVVTTPVPIPDFNPAVGEGGSVIFHNATTNVDGANIFAFKYVWDFGDGASGNTQTSPDHTYAVPGTYEVSLTATPFAGGEAVSITKQVPVSFAVAPVAGFTHIITEDLVVFTNTSTGIDNTYVWNFSDGQNSIEQSPVIVFTEPGIYNAQLTVTNAAGTNSTSQNVTITFQREGTMIHTIYEDTQILGQLTIDHTNNIDQHVVAPILEGLLAQTAGLSAANVQAAIDLAIANLIDGNPEALNTLKEITDAMSAADATVTSALLQQIVDAKNELKGTVDSSLDTMQEIVEKAGFTDEGGVQALNATDGTNNLSSFLTIQQRSNIAQSLLAVVLMINAETARALTAEAAITANVNAETARALAAEGVLSNDIAVNADAIGALATATASNLAGTLNALIGGASTDFDTLGKIEARIGEDRVRLEALETSTATLQENINAAAAQAQQNLDDAINALKSSINETGFSTDIDLFPGGIAAVMPVACTIDKGWDIASTVVDVSLLLADGTVVNAGFPVTCKSITLDSGQPTQRAGILVQCYLRKAPAASKLRVIANNTALLV